MGQPRVKPEDCDHPIDAYYYVAHNNAFCLDCKTGLNLSEEIEKWQKKYAALKLSIENKGEGQ